MELGSRGGGGGGGELSLGGGSGSSAIGSSSFLFAILCNPTGSDSERLI